MLSRILGPAAGSAVAGELALTVRTTFGQIAAGIVYDVAVV